MHKDGGEIIKLDICKKHPVEKDKKFRSVGTGTFGL
jgi:hypothetical protein